jgi:polyhydroxyalkanoate synthesis regulator phasin
MESIGAVQTVLEIWETCPNAYVAAIVTDEDSTTRSKLSHKMEDLVAAGKMSEEERRYVSKIPGRLGPKKDDHGELPLDHPEIEKLADPIHYVKSYKSNLYVLVSASKTKSQTCKADAMRLSRNLAYMLAQYKRGTENCTFEKFEIAAKASFEHHWNDHQYCGSWCQAKNWSAEEKEKTRTDTETKNSIKKNTCSNSKSRKNLPRRRG